MSSVSFQFLFVFSTIAVVFIRNANSVCSVEFYQHGSFEGTMYGPFTDGDYPDAASQGNGLLNDDVSSLKLTGGGSCRVEVFADYGFGGVSDIFYPGDYGWISDNGGFPNDVLSSFKVYALTTTASPSTSTTETRCGTLEIDYYLGECSALFPGDINAIHADIAGQITAALGVNGAIANAIATESAALTNDIDALETATDTKITEAVAAEAARIDLIVAADRQTAQDAIDALTERLDGLEERLSGAVPAAMTAHSAVDVTANPKAAPSEWMSGNVTAIIAVLALTNVFWFAAVVYIACRMRTLGRTDRRNQKDSWHSYSRTGTGSDSGQEIESDA